MKNLPFTLPTLTGDELGNLAAVLDSRHLAGDGVFTAKCHELLEGMFGAPCLLTHSCTAALEMAAILAEIAPGDEVIMPSFTFVSTANAFVLRGAVPVFVDIRPDTLNMDERLLEQAMSPRVRAIVPVHYAGVPCDMTAICEFSRSKGLVVIEDAAQALGSEIEGRMAGTHGTLSAISFHQTKNIMSGEGGALVINDETMVERAAIIREKGTNRTQFLRREVSKYEWLDIGSSYLPSELVAAVLLPQLQHAKEITSRRLTLWNRYHTALRSLEEEGLAIRPQIPTGVRHNAHIYYVLLPREDIRLLVNAALAKAGIGATSHYVPLHSSPAGLRFGRVAGGIEVTNRVAASLLRLPLFPDMAETEVDRVVDVLERALRAHL